MQRIPLYCTISQNGNLFAIHYKGQPGMKCERTGHSISTFDDCPDDCPVIDYRTATLEAIFAYVIDRCSGTFEEQPQPYDHESRFLKSPMFSPVPLQTLLEYAKEAGATITTVGQVK